MVFVTWVLHPVWACTNRLQYDGFLPSRGEILFHLRTGPTAKVAVVEIVVFTPGKSCNISKITSFTMLTIGQFEQRVQFWLAATGRFFPLFLKLLREKQQCVQSLYPPRAWNIVWYGDG